MAIKDLFEKELKIINIGLFSFKESLEEANFKVFQVNWEPPAGGDEEVLDALKKLLNS
ncbi:MAG: fdrA domain protein [Atribacteria sp.]|nr:fdrA domain protein [Candidatus Atribacteria bacterium]MBU4047140.1 fdrA domain protein [bacterium]PKP58299.1 MAG: fdrA domain protein [Candidatus Atribacteria bacterium HGW-Atribacteria-1]